MPHCCVPQCTNHSKKTSNTSYHKIPSDHVSQKAWIARIKRENLPALKNCYVCSDHFEDSCFEVDLTEQLTGIKRKRKLKGDAIPTKFSFSSKPAKRRATSENRLKRQQDKEMLSQLFLSNENLPCQEMSTCGDGNGNDELQEVVQTDLEEKSKDVGIQCCLDHEPQYHVTKTISTQTNTEPQDEMPSDDESLEDWSLLKNTKPITDHTYSRPCEPSPKKFVLVSPQKSVSSTMSEEMELESDDSDSDFPPLSQDGSSTTDTDSESQPEDILQSHIKEPKYIVFQSCILQLFRFCSSCGAAVTDVSYRHKGSLLTVITTCMEHHLVTWNSQPIINRLAVGNLLMCASLVFTGSTYGPFKNFASCLGLRILSERVFYRHQEKYLFPVINDTWKREEATVVEQLSSKEIVNLSGDGRCDSPGHNAKYNTYTMMDKDSGKIATFKVIQVTEVSSSNAMEKEGFVRCIEALQENITITSITTDRHISITSAMDKEYKHIKHQYDVWHLSKSIVKKLNKKAKVKKYADLAPWIQSISNHLWWSAASCNGDAQLLREKWKSVIHHVANKHSWNDSDKFHKCAHPRLSRREARSKCWLKPGSPAHVSLEEIVLNPKLLNDLAKLTDFCHTGGLEVYHSLVLKYCPKREHFSYKGMVARTQLAALDNNHNTGRKQALIQRGERKGEARYRQCFPKMHKRWVVKPVLEKKNYDFLPQLQMKVLQMVEGDFIDPIDEINHPKNIASKPAPDKKDLIAKHRSRFS